MFNWENKLKLLNLNIRAKFKNDCYNKNNSYKR
jgi:hypothetical protein